MKFGHLLLYTWKPEFLKISLCFTNTDSPTEINTLKIKTPLLLHVDVIPPRKQVDDFRYTIVRFFIHGFNGRKKCLTFFVNLSQLRCKSILSRCLLADTDPCDISAAEKKIQQQLVHHVHRNPVVSSQWRGINVNEELRVTRDLVPFGQFFTCAEQNINPMNRANFRARPCFCSRQVYILPNRD